MEIKVSSLESVKEIIWSAKKSSNDNCHEELCICHPKAMIIIMYGKSDRSIIIQLTDQESIMRWDNGDISYDEIKSFLDNQIK